MWIVFLFSKIFPKPLDSFRKRVYNNIWTNKCSDLQKAVVVEGGESSKRAGCGLWVPEGAGRLVAAPNRVLKNESR